MFENDSFNEKLVAKKKSAKDIAIFIGILIAGFFLIYNILMFAGYLRHIFMFLIAAVFYGMYQALICLNVEYEYALTNGELDIDKITAQRRRKRIISVDTKDFEYFAPLNDEHKAVYNGEYAKKIDVFSSPDAKDIYFAYFFKNGQKIRLAFQPSEKMIDAIKFKMPRSMFHA